MNSEAEAKDRVDEEVSAEIRVGMEARVEDADTKIRAGAEAKKVLILKMISQRACSRRVASSTCD